MERDALRLLTQAGLLSGQRRERADIAVVGQHGDGVAETKCPVLRVQHGLLDAGQAVVHVGR